MAATCLHESFLLVSDFEDTTELRDTFVVLLQDDSTDVMTAITLKLDVLIAKFCNQHTIAQS